MSTRKTAAAAVTTVRAATPTVKSENMTTKGTSASTTATKTVVAASTNSTPSATITTVDAKAEMGSNASSGTCTVAEISESTESVNANTSTNKESTTKTDTRRASSEPKRLLRNSPLLLASPTPSTSTKKESRNNETCDLELTNSESEDGASGRRSLPIKGRKSLKECRETKLGAENDKTEENNAPGAIESNKEVKNVKEKDIKGTKETKDDEKKADLETRGIEKDIVLTNAHANNTPASSSATAATSSHPTPTALSSSSVTTTTTNRLTRKSVAHEIVTNTRVTRNRQSNTLRPETPPIITAPTGTSTRPRRSNAGKKTSFFSSSEPAAKRKRGEDDGTPSGSTESLSGKVIKVEPKDDPEMTEDELPSVFSVTSNNEIETLKIKSEPVESDESATEAGSTSSSVTRSRSRWSVRKPQQSNQQSSPSTRATRHSKNASPSPSPTTSSTSSASGVTAAESKRRRTNVQSNALPRSSSQTLLKTATAGGTNPNATPLHVPDEDSKDSMTSSIDDLLTDIKMEKLTPDLADEVIADIEVEKKQIDVASSSVSVPLTVETETEIKTDKKDSAVDETKEVIVVKEHSSTPVSRTSDFTSVSEDTLKASSLSPELVSEGVSEISVKKFYKKPKFLENNLGIEEDPKLGEIVQKVTTEREKEQEQIITEDKDLAATSISVKNKSETDEIDAISVESDEIKEGDLRVDDSNEDKKCSFNEDDNSLGTEILSPLVIEEDDEVETVADDDKEPMECEKVETAITEKEKHEKFAEEINNTDEVDAEDDVTMEECETISMDNNASVHEDMNDTNVDGDYENTTEDLETKIDLDVSDVKEITEKTKTECDSIQAKLKDESENNIETKDEIIKDKKDLKLKRLDEEEKLQEKYSENKPIQMDIDGDECVDLAETMDTIHSEEDDETKLCIDMPEENTSAANMEIIENIEDDEVVAKIDAELKKYDDLEKSKFSEKAVRTDSASFDKKIKDNEIKLPAILKNEAESTKATALLGKIENVPVAEKPILDSVNKSENKDPNKSEPIEKEISISSTTNSPTKPSACHKEDDSTSMKSGQSTDSSSWVTLDLEHDEEALRQKEQHFQNLGLLTHKAAEKRRLEYIQSSAAAEATRAQHQNSSSSKRNGKSSSSALSHEYTGTLKTVIKINRNTTGGSHASTSGTGRKSNGTGGQHATAIAGTSRDSANGSTVRRQSLKMTFQKGRGRGQGNTDRAADNHSNVEDAYYTIQNENEGGLKAGNAGSTAEHTNVQTHGRKSYNRSNTTSHSTNTAIIDSSHSDGYDTVHHHTIASTSHKKDEKEEILIPEKASSFKFHPGRLCDDQCFYCSGKFGLYDTPCHVGQIKSAERQQKILANEEKLTVDSCLCDACFRHVDRRANVPSYKKRMSVTTHVGSAGTSTAGGEAVDNVTAVEVEDDPRSHKCLVPDCANPAAHSLRRKCIRKSVKKFLLNFDMPTGSTCVWLCQAHYDTVIQCSGCVLCKRRLGKNHMYHITSDTDRLEKALSEMGIPVQLGIGTAVCKLCRYFANLLMKPPDSTKSQKAEFVKNYRKRLLQFHNIHDGSNDASEADDEDNNGNTLTSGTDKSLASKNKTPQKLDNIDNSIVEDVTPVKNLPSPAESNGSSIECLGETTTMEVSGNEDNDTEKQPPKKRRLTITNDVLGDYEAPATLSTDSSSSSAPMSPTNCSGAGKQQMSKLKAILQSSSGNSGGSTSALKTSISSASGVAANDISNVLRANPNISMRELFPGEEDLGLNFKVPFGSSTSQRTPEGWTRVQTFLQYDEATRRLWEDLQKPYGNQSSFLRHLILLEKYYRNGDLVLSPNASSNASVYTQTVRQRLTSYDQGHCGGLLSAKPSPATSKRSSTDIPTVEINEDDDEPKRASSNGSSAQQTDVDRVARELQNPVRAKRSRSDSVDKLTKQLSSNAVTIIARPKPQPQLGGDPSPQKSLLKDKSSDNSLVASTTLTALSGNSPNSSGSSNCNNANSSNTSGNSRSILKTNLLGMNKAVEIVPISAPSSTGAPGNQTAVSTGKTTTGNNTTVSSESKHQKILELANKLLDNRIEAAAAAAAEQTKNGSGTSLLTSPPELVSLDRRPACAASGSTSTSTSSAAPPTSITPVSSLTASLINNKRPQGAPKPVSSVSESSTAAKHRTAPPNVVILPDTLTLREHQQRNWRPTLMPVEENLHLIDKGGPLYQTADGRRLPALVQVLSGGKPFLISIFDYNRMCILRREKLLRDRMLKGKKSHDDKHQQNQQQQQPQANKTATSHSAQISNFNKHAGKQQQLQQQQQQQQAAQQQLMHLQMMQMQKQAALKAPNRYQSIAPKSTATTSHNGSGGGGNGPSTSHAPATNVNVPSSNSNVFSSPMMPLLTNAFANPNPNPLAVAAAAAAATAKLNPNAWIWNFPEANHMLNGNMVNVQGAQKLPQLLHKGPTMGGAGGNIPATITSKQQQQQMLIDNTLMSKIPKTLTVIPQHKLMSNSGSTSTNISHKE